MTKSLTERVETATQQVESAGEVYSEVKCADSNTMVDTSCGMVPSLRKVLKDLGGYQYKGEWKANTAYEAKDQVKDADGVIWLCIENHTSSADFDADSQSGKWIAFQVIRDTPVFNRRVIDFGLGVTFGPYVEDGRTLLPRLRIGAVEYVPVSDITENLAFTSADIEDHFDGTVAVQTSLGVKVFSKIDAEAVIRNDISIEYRKTIADAKRSQYFSIEKVIITDLANAPFEKISNPDSYPDIAKYQNLNGQWWGIATKEGSANLKWFGAKGDGITLDTLIVQEAMNWCAENNISLICPSGTYLVDSNPGNSVGAVIAVPNNSNIHMDKSCKWQLADNQPPWTRLIAIISGTTNVNIYGTLRINAAGTTHIDNNEHMHGLFIYNSKDVYIERVESEDARGDNISISGSGNTEYSENITIGTVVCRKAGRKCLVIEACKGLYIGNAVLDNSEGGDNRDGEHCLDYEPFGDFDYKGEKLSARIGNLETYGTGDDFTMGLSYEKSSIYPISIGRYVMRLMAKVVSGTQLHSLATHLIIDSLRIVGDPNTEYAPKGDSGIISFRGGARAVIKDCYIDVNIASADSQHLYINGSSYGGVTDGNPEIYINNFTSISKNGSAIEHWGGVFKSNSVHVFRDISNTSQYASLHIGSQHIVNSVWLKNITRMSVSNYADTVWTAIDYSNVFIEDERSIESIESPYFFNPSINTNQATRIGTWNIPDTHKIVKNANGGSNYFKLSGGNGQTSICHYYAEFDPNDRITAGIGSTASTTLGFFIKTTDADTSTGWKKV